MTRINVASYKTESRNFDIRNSVTWGRAIRNNSGPLVFAAVLIVCSLTVGCSSEKPQPISSNNPAPVPQPTNTVATSNAPAPLPEIKPAAKKAAAKKRPATITYTDKTYGVSFAYPRRYAIETGDAAKDLLISSPLPMNFVQPGGMALAAVELPETGFANTDFSSAFFNVSVNNALSEDQCTEFSVPQAKAATPPAQADAKPIAQTPVAPDAPSSKLMLGDLEMHGAEAVSGEGTRQSDSKYFHVFQNGACYEFALNVTTNAAQADASLKHIDRDRIFARLESILSTVKIEQGKIEQGKTEQTQPKTVDSKQIESNGSPQDVHAGNHDTTQTNPAGDDATKPAPSNSEVTPEKPVSPPDSQPAPVAAAAPAASEQMPPQ